MFFENQDESYTMIDLYLYDRFFGHKDSSNYYDNDVDKILFKKSDNEYIIRYNDVNKMTVVPLQLKVKIFFGKMHELKNNIAVMSIKSDDKNLFRKIREIWNKIIELIGINNAKDFVKNTIDDADEFIMVDVHKNASFVKGSNSDEFVIVLHSIVDNDLKTSLVQAKTVFSFLLIFNKFEA